MTPTAEQARAVEAVLDWYEKRLTPFLTFGGYAGVGKSFCVRVLVEALRGDVKVLAPTGKACQVLRKKGVDADTVHSWLYGAPEAQLADGELIWGEPNPQGHPDLLVVDESSMVYREMFEDLLGLGIPILFVGDHGQLEPVGDNPKLMVDPAVRLETIMRQAAESPILRFAHAVRTGARMIGCDGNGLSVRRANGALGSRDFLLSFDQVITAFNRVRQGLNKTMRGKTRELLVEGEKVICLRNNRRQGLFNGLMGKVTAVRDRFVNDVVFDFVSDDGRPYFHVRAWADQFGAETTLRDVPRGVNLFDYGYAITCHKSQGSEWPTVLVAENRCDNWSMERWRYTAVTRAAERLTYLSNEIVDQAQIDLFGDAA